MKSKKDWRALLLEKIAQMSDCQRTQEGAAALELLTGMEEYRRGGTIFTFLGVGWEMDTGALISKMLAGGKRVLLPRTGSNGRMEAVEVFSLEGLETSAYGIPEPPAERPAADPCLIDLILVPGLGFDRQGGRLGRGGGYYDRYLAGTQAVTVGLCYRACLVDRLPMERWDRPVDIVLTADGAFRATSSCGEGFVR